jgi:ferredoxin
MDLISEDIVEGQRKKGKIRKIVVDREACIGARSCVVVAPGVFQMDDDNLAYIVDPDANEDDVVKMAAEACPVLAVHLYDEDGNKIFPKE